MAENLPLGTRIEVRTGFDRSWAKGFEVASLRHEDGYRVRRLSDGQVLPVAFAMDDVRRERRSAMWWV